MIPASFLKDPNFRKKGRKRRPAKGGSDLGDLLSTLRTAQGWTLLEAGRESGISHRIIAKLEKGQLETSISNLDRYLRFFGFILAAKRIETLDQKTETHPNDLDEKGLPKW